MDTNLITKAPLPRNLQIWATTSLLAAVAAILVLTYVAKDGPAGSALGAITALLIFLNCMVSMLACMGYKLMQNLPEGASWIQRAGTWYGRFVFAAILGGLGFSFYAFLVRPLMARRAERMEQAQMPHSNHSVERPAAR